MKWKAAVIALALCMGHAAKAQSESCRPDRAVFLGGAVPVTVPVEIADDPQERARGLMFRRHLAPGTGMLFIYEAPQRVSFWMRGARCATSSPWPARWTKPRSRGRQSAIPHPSG